MTTLDTDIWVDLPERAYMRVINLCNRLGACILAPTAVALGDETMINFLYRVDGLRSFAVEFKRAEKLRWLGTTVAVMPIQSIIRSKKYVARPKDLAHIPVLEETLRLKNQLRKRK